MESIMNDTELKLIEIFKVCLALEIDEEGIRKLTRQNCAKWDSMHHLNIILSTEQSLDVSIPEDKGSEVNSFQDMLRLVGILKT